jgi:glc operon protein GlcG
MARATVTLARPDRLIAAHIRVRENKNSTREEVMRHFVVTVLAALAATCVSVSAQAQAPAAPAAPAGPPPAYGTPITISQAEAAAMAAEAEAKKNNLNLAIAIVDPSGSLVYFRRADTLSYASVQISQDKARSAALFRNATKSYQDRLAAGQTFILGLAGAVPVEGGVPIVVGGKIIGAIGTSGASPQQDGQAATAGAAAVK